MPNLKRRKANLPPAEQLIEELIKEKSFRPLILKYDCLYTTLYERMNELPDALKTAKKLIRVKRKEIISTIKKQQMEYAKPHNHHSRFTNLLQEYTDMEGNVKALGAKYKLSSDRIKQLLAEKNSEYQMAKELVKQKKHELIQQQFLELTKSKGSVPTLNEIRKKNVKMVSLYYSLRKAAEKEGFTFKRKISLEEIEKKKSEMLQHLKDLAIALNHTPITKEIRAAGKYTATLYRNYFGSLRNAQKLAGLSPSPLGKRSTKLRKTSLPEDSYSLK